MLELISAAFPPYGHIDRRHANRGIDGGLNISIPYAWTGEPAGTKSFALALVDRAAVAHDWVHWLVVDLPAQAHELVEGASGTDAMPGGARELTNTSGHVGYGGPQPPAGTGEHAYEATLFALDVPALSVADPVALDGFISALDGHVIAQASYTGRFAHP